MKKASLTIQYDEERLSTVILYLEKKGININDEIVKFIDTLYAKNVPATIRNFFEMKAESERARTIASNK